MQAETFRVLRSSVHVSAPTTIVTVCVPLNVTSDVPVLTTVSAFAPPAAAKIAVAVKACAIVPDTGHGFVPRGRFHVTFVPTRVPTT